MAKGIKVPKRAAQTPSVQVTARVTPELAHRVKVYAAQNKMLVQDIIAAGIRAVIGEKTAA